jgi:nucleotide-binding universal stress UspA family protein
MELLPLLVAVDFSELSPKAIEYAVRLANNRGRRIDLLHVALHSLPAHVEAHAPAEVLQQIRKSEETTAITDLRALMDAHVPSALRGQVLLRRGPPADTICKIAAEGYEMVVVSTRGRTGLAHVLIGSVAERVVRHSPTAVLVVR